MTVRETVCKSALVKSGIADYALNPYTGCAHSCAYCYASFMARFSRHDRPWGQWVDAKINIAAVLARDLRRLQRLQREARGGPVEVVISSVTDAYQPLERGYRLTRACLEAIAESVSQGSLERPLLGLPVDPSLGLSPSRPGPETWLRVSILTKSDLVVRDLDVLQDIPSLEAGMTITTVDDTVSRLYEPAAPPATKRLSALKRLSDAGIRTWAFLSPLLPYHSDSERAVRSILVAVRDAGVARVMVDRFNPYPASVSRFLKAAPAEAAQALRGYVAGPLGYLGRLRETVTEAAADLKLDLKVLF
ncbi:MAG: radical SAM protein [Bacillota bacterium]|nr:radical SAM protein [Bacillota bacterium]